MTSIGHSTIRRIRLMQLRGDGLLTSMLICEPGIGWSSIMAGEINRRLEALELAVKLGERSQIPTLSDWYGKGDAPCRRGGVRVRVIDFYDEGGAGNA